jgi:hypothetical protein
MADCAMPNENPVADDTASRMIYVQYAIILDVAARSNDNGRDIAPEDSVIPDTRIFSNAHIPNKARARRYKNRRRNIRRLPLKAKTVFFQVILPWVGLFLAGLSCLIIVPIKKAESTERRGVKLP